MTTAISAAPNPQLDVRHAGIGMAADDGRQAWKVLALDKATGKLLWEQAAFEGVPRVKRHLKASHASATPATDGTHVVALFGSEGLYCYDVSGRLLWKQDLGVMNTGLVGDEGVQWGPASSPIIHGPLVIVQNDRQRESFLAAYELKSGEQVWKIERDEFPSWATPLVMTANGRSELVVNASKFVRGYDPMTGRELWRMPDAETQVKVPSPVAGPGMAIVTGGYPRGSRPIYAIKPQQQGADRPRSGIRLLVALGARLAVRADAACLRREYCMCWPTTACWRRTTSPPVRVCTSSGWTRRRLASARRPSAPAVTSIWPARTAMCSS